MSVHIFSGWGKVREEGLGMAGKLKEVLKHRIFILQLKFNYH